MLLDEVLAIFVASLDAFEDMVDGLGVVVKPVTFMIMILDSLDFQERRGKLPLVLDAFIQANHGLGKPLIALI